MSDSETTSTAVPNTELSLAARIEAMLFVSAEPVPVAQLATGIGCDRLCGGTRTQGIG